MKKNQFEQIEDSVMKVENTIQMDLACMNVEKPHVTSEEFSEWTMQYAARFRDLIESRPDLLTLYNDNREEALKQIEHVLYAEEK